MIEDVNLKDYAELETVIDDETNYQEAQPVVSQTHDWTISTLRDKYERGQIDLQPHYQREYVWEKRPELPSRLIESLLLQIPIPPLYFFRLNSGKIEVVDGQQRLTTLLRFVRNEFRLQKLQKLSSLNDKLFKELPEREQEKIMDAAIRSIVIDAGTNHELRYEIFERLNRGAIALNEQEIRNCAYRGRFCDLLAELEKEPVWRKIKGSETPEPRFVEREMILRFFAFANRIDHYGNNLRSFLNDYMGKYAPNDAEKVNELAALFRQTMQNVWIAFGEHSARLYTIPEGESLSEGRWEPKFSISALDIQAASLIGYSSNKVQAAGPHIKEAYKFFLATNPQIRDAIRLRPAGTEATKTRWFKFKTIVQEIISSPKLSTSGSDPLFDAKALYRAGFFPAAGAMAGVILEGHLKRLCLSRNLQIAFDKDGINNANNTLRTAGVYDLTQHRRVQVMGDIRNRCDHATTNPAKKEEVWELIEDVDKLMQQFPLP